MNFPGLGMPVHFSEWIEDGRVINLNGAFFIGTVRETDAQHDARRIVREGLQEELKWLGLPTRTGREVWSLIKSSTAPTAR